MGSAVRKDEAGEVGRGQLDQGQLCMVPYTEEGPQACRSPKDLNMEVSSSHLCFRKIIAICITGLGICILFGSATLS